MPDNEKLKEKLKTLNSTEKIEVEEMTTSQNEWYNMLCRGEKVRTTGKVKLKYLIIFIKITIKISNYSTNSSLKCYFLSNGHPFLIIGPVKEEIVSFVPFIAIYHDVITESQATQIKDFAIPNVI